MSEDDEELEREIEEQLELCRRHYNSEEAIAECMSWDPREICDCSTDYDLSICGCSIEDEIEEAEDDDGTLYFGEEE